MQKLLEGEIHIDPTKLIEIKLDLKKQITQANNTLVSICGYTKSELIGLPVQIFHHPDMPSLIYKFLSFRLSKGKNVYLVEKKTTLDKKYYWVITKLINIFDSNGETIGFKVLQRVAPIAIVNTFEKFYNELKKIEIDEGYMASVEYFVSLLEGIGMRYDDFFFTNTGMNQKTLDAFFNLKDVKEENEISIKKSHRPVPIDVEVKLDPSKISMSKTNLKGIIEYANESFMKTCEYEEAELMGQQHNIVRHPDMPRTVFKYMWDTLPKGKGLYAIVKNMTKYGKYYWVIAKVYPKLDKSGKPIAYYARRKAVSNEAVYKVQKLYKLLKSIEVNQSLAVAEKYFYGLLEEKRVSYNDFVLDILDTTEEALNKYFEGSEFKTQRELKKRKGFFERLFD